MYNLEKLSKEGTIFSTILFDGEKIKKLKLPYKSKLDENDYMIIEKGTMNNTIIVSHPHFGSEEEYIVNISDFEIEMKNIGFTRLERFTFAEILHLIHQRMSTMNILENNDI